MIYYSLFRSGLVITLDRLVQHHLYISGERGRADHYCTTALNNNKSKTKYGKELVPDGSAGHRHARQWEAHAQLSVGYRLLLCGVGMSCGVDQ